MGTLIRINFLFMFLSLFIVPPLFGLVALVNGFIITGKGEHIHGPLHCILAAVCATLGMVFGYYVGV